MDADRSPDEEGPLLTERPGSGALVLAWAVLRRIVVAGLWVLPVVLVFVALPVVARSVLHLDRAGEDAVGVLAALGMAAVLGWLAFGRGGRRGGPVDRHRGRLPRPLSRRRHDH